MFPALGVPLSSVTGSVLFTGNVLVRVAYDPAGLSACGWSKENAAAATHPVLSGHAVSRITGSGLTSMVVTDTLPLAVPSQKIEVESVAQVFAEAIKRSFKNQSISSLFDVDKG